MKRNYKIGDKISLVAVSQRRTRLECVGTVKEKGEMGGPYVIIENPAFKKPPQLELIAGLIEDSPQGLVYKGDVGGAVLVPDFLWVAP